MKLQNDLLARRPIQYYYCQDIKRFIIVLNETIKNICYVEIHQEKIKVTIMKVPYFEWDLKTKVCSEDKSKVVTAPCLLLPNLIHNTDKIYYCCINKEFTYTKRIYD